MEQTLNTGAAGAAPSTLELLLGADVTSVKANLPTARYEVPRLSRRQARRWCSRCGPCPTAESRSSNA